MDWESRKLAWVCIIKSYQDITSQVPPRKSGLDFQLADVKDSSLYHWPGLRQKRFDGYVP